MVQILKWYSPFSSEVSPSSKDGSPTDLVSYGDRKQGEGSFRYPVAIVFPNSGEKAQVEVGREAEG